MSQPQPTEYEYRLLTQVADLSLENGQFRGYIQDLQAENAKQAARLAELEPAEVAVDGDGK